MLDHEKQLLRALLYFNLPYETIIKDQMVPKLVAWYQRDSPNNSFASMLKDYESNTVNQTYTMSIVLIKVDHQSQSEESQEKHLKSFIIGGFASHSWSSLQAKKGNESCFLFNLTLNLRFNAREGLDYYQYSSLQQGKEELRFGNSDLCLKPVDQQLVLTSKI